MPKSLICYFSPSIRQNLVMAQEKVVLLEQCDKSSASWVLRWMLAGGIDKTGTSSEVLEDEVAKMDILLHRLQVADQLRLGQLCESISKEVLNLFTVTAVTAEQIEWAYSCGLDFTASGLRATIAEGIRNLAVEHELIYPKNTLINNPYLYHDMVLKVDTIETVKLVGAAQRIGPLSLDQIRFLYEFTAFHGHVRKTVAHGLLKLISTGKIANDQAYRDLAWQNADFDYDVTAAIEAKQRAEDHAQYLERRARREAKAAAAKQTPKHKNTNVNLSSGQHVPVAGKATEIASGRAAKGRRASGVTTVEGTPVKPAKRLESNVMLRLDSTGAVAKER
ncbi:MAG: hypothetical protein LQ347_002260 [Umbilicaria vellea]|nr:MAG: hypothetical protein LQ347_002260 [Umbilicaria vellea]